MKLYYEALRLLPDEFVDNETKACIFDETKVIAVNPEYEPIVYEDGVWYKFSEKFDLSKEPYVKTKK